MSYLVCKRGGYCLLVAMFLKQILCEIDDIPSTINQAIQHLGLQQCSRKLQGMPM